MTIDFSQRQAICTLRSTFHNNMTTTQQSLRSPLMSKRSIMLWPKRALPKVCESWIRLSKIERWTNRQQIKWLQTIATKPESKQITLIRMAYKVTVAMPAPHVVVVKVISRLRAWQSQIKSHTSKNQLPMFKYFHIIYSSSWWCKMRILSFQHIIIALQAMHPLMVVQLPISRSTTRYCRGQSKT